MACDVSPVAMFCFLVRLVVYLSAFFLHTFSYGIAAYHIILHSSGNFCYIWCLFVVAVQCDLTTKRNNSCNFSCAISNLPPNIWGWKDERKNSNWAENQEKNPESSSRVHNRHILKPRRVLPEHEIRDLQWRFSILKSSNFRRWTVSRDGEDLSILQQLWLIITHAFIVKSLLNSLK